MAGEARELPGSWFWRGAGEFEPTRCWTGLSGTAERRGADVVATRCLRHTARERTMVQSRRLGV